jgi:hypothetical protein
MSSGEIVVFVVLVFGVLPIKDNLSTGWDQCLPSADEPAHAPELPGPVVDYLSISLVYQALDNL